MSNRQTVTIADKFAFEGKVTINDTECIPCDSLTFDENFDPRSKIVEVCKSKGPNGFNIVLRTPGKGGGFRLPRIPGQRSAFHQAVENRASSLPLVKLTLIGGTFGLAALIFMNTCAK